MSVCAECIPFPRLAKETPRPNCTIWIDLAASLSKIVAVSAHSSMIDRQADVQPDFPTQLLIDDPQAQTRLM